jgi:hypothetical protein
MNIQEGKVKVPQGLKSVRENRVVPPESVS